MKKVITIIILILLSFISFGQNKGAIKFLGIPIDGTRSHFYSELKEKGFIYNSVFDNFRGQFNGESVNVYVHTNHDVVDRVYVSFPETSENDIKIDFNRLVKQFKDNGKYLDLSMNTEISEDEDISYEISINQKRYQASFSYFDPDRDKEVLLDAVFDKCQEYFSDEQMYKLKGNVKKIIDAPETERQLLLVQMLADLQSINPKQNDNERGNGLFWLQLSLTIMEEVNALADGEVWFTIRENHRRYSICLYYDNLHNQAHGEDL